MTQQVYTTSALAMIDITSVHNDAIRVPFADVRPGDWVFDAWGDRHKLVKARVLKRGALSIKREDLPWTEHIELNDDRRGAHSGQIVIVPEHGWTTDGHGYRQLPGQDDSPGFKFGEFYETCRCGVTFGSGADGDESTASTLLNQHADEANGREIYGG